MDIALMGKTIDTRPIQHLVTQGEALADYVNIEIPLAYGEIDLSSLTFTMKGVSEADTIAAQVLTKSIRANYILLSWVIDEDFAAVDGKIWLTITGADAEGNIRIKFVGDPIFVRKDVTAGGGITPNALEALLAQCSYQVQLASDEADAAAASAETASGSANAAAASAATAGTKATEAAASATLSEQKATAAAASATAAQNSATSAAGYAERAEDAAESVENPAKATDLTDTHFGKAMQMEVADIPYNLGMTQYGQCVQDGIPTPAAPVPITYPNAGASVYGKNLLPLLAQSYTANGITITRNADSYTFNGSATGLTFNNYDNNLGFLRKGQTYSITMKSDKHSGNITFQVFTTDSDGTIIAYLVNLKSDLETRVLTFSTPDTPDVARISARAYVDNGKTVSSETITIQIEHGSTATAYEPYKTPISIVVKDTNNADVPLYGIPVASNGNVTIGGQQYIADTLVDNGDGTGTANRRVKVVDAGTMAWAYYAAGSYFYSNSLTDKKGGSDNLLCTAYARGSSNGCMRGVANANTVVAYNTDYTDAAAFKAAMSGVLIYYKLETHITETVAITYSDTPTAISPIASWLSDAYSAVKTGVYQALKSAYAEINLLRSMMTI